MRSMSAGGCPVTANLRMPAGGLVAYGGISMDRVKQIAVYGFSCIHAEADFRPGQPCLWTGGSPLTAQPMVIFRFIHIPTSISFGTLDPDPHLPPDQGQQSRTVELESRSPKADILQARSKAARRRKSSRLADLPSTSHRVVPVTRPSPCTQIRG